MMVKLVSLSSTLVRDELEVCTQQPFAVKFGQEPIKFDGLLVWQEPIKWAPGLACVQTSPS